MEDSLDVCYEDNECLKQGTNWKLVWTFNGSYMVIMGCNYILLALGSFFFWPRLIGSYLNCCLGCCGMVGGIIALYYTMFALGELCSYNEMVNTITTDEFVDDGMTFRVFELDGMTYQTDWYMM